MLFYLKNEIHPKKEKHDFPIFENTVSITDSPWRRIIPANGQETNADFRLGMKKLAAELV